MAISEYFPQKLALGKNFCNRETTQQHLKDNILGVRPTLIMSPRRYGKTSLGIQVIQKLDLPYSHLDLFPVTSVQEIQNIIFGGIGDILAALEPRKKALQIVASFFSELSVSFKLLNSKIAVDLTHSGSQHVQTLLNALINLDATLLKKKKRAVLFLDEFQRLSQMPHAETIEGAIRHAAQKTQNLAFIFSGSNLHLLGYMFDDSMRPLYKLCDRIVLERISAYEYELFLQKMAKHRWQQDLTAAAIEKILNLTARHPYYVNVLCARLWRNPRIFSYEEVELTWHNYALEEKSTVFKELETLSGNQLKLLIALARHSGIKAHLSDEFVDFAKLPLASLRQSMIALQDKDYVYQDQEKHYRVLDPLFEYILKNRPD